MDAPALAGMDESKLLPFQREGVERGMALNGRILLGDEMGLGADRAGHCFGLPLPARVAAARDCTNIDVSALV